MALWLAALGLALLAAQAAQLQWRKAGQRLYAPVTARLARGEADGKVLGTLAVAADAGGRLFHLDELNERWRLQRFAPDLGWELTRTGALQPGQHAVGLLVSAEGSATLAFDDGALLELDQRLEHPRSRASLGPLSHLYPDGQGGLWALRAQAPYLAHLDAAFHELPLGGALAGLAERPAAMAVGGGQVALLFARGAEAQQARLYDSGGARLTSFEVPIRAAPAHGLALVGRFVLFNENKLGRGLSVYSWSGRYVGQLTNFGPKELIPFQGLVCAADKADEAWVGHTNGLTRFSTRGWEL